MTTPNQPPPDNAYVLGGGELKYGQEMSEEYARALWEPQAPTLSTAIPMFRDALRMAPGGSLKPIQTLIQTEDPETGEVVNITEDEYVDSITDNVDDNWFQRIFKKFNEATTGNPDSGKTLDDFFNSAFKLRKETNANTAGIAQLRADLNGNNNSGGTFIVSVADYGTTMPSVLTKKIDIGVSTVTNDGDTLEMSNDDGIEIYAYNIQPLLTDYPEVSLVVPRQAGTYFGGYGDRALYWIFRANEDFSTFTFARLNGNKLRVGCVQAGVTTLTSPTWFGSGPTGAGPVEVTIDTSSYMTVQGGYLEDGKTIRFLSNNQVVATFYDAAAVSTIDEDHRWTGLGIQNDRNDSINRVPNISHFMANDNEPTPVQGSGARISRIATSGENFASTDPSAFPSGFFNFTNEKTPDIAPNPTDGGFIVTEGDWYTITVRLQVGLGFPNGIQFLLFRNGVEDVWIGGEIGFITRIGGGAFTPQSAGVTGQIYLNGGDSVQIGYMCTGGSGIFVGETTGFKSHLTISRGK